jgi:hypothetical protein
VVPAEKNIHIKKWREKTKQRILDSFGRSCACCGYIGCHSVMELHHLDPNEKEFAFSRVRANPRSWEKIVLELRKCVLLCCRCHREVHAKVIDVPNNAPRFDENYATYNNWPAPIPTECTVCHSLKHPSLKFCSPECSSMAQRKIDWDAFDLPEMLKIYKTYVAVANQLGVSDNALRKRLRKMGLRT